MCNQILKLGTDAGNKTVQNDSQNMLGSRTSFHSVKVRGFYVLLTLSNDW